MPSAELTADRMRPEVVEIGGTSLVRFSDHDLAALHPNPRAELRSKARGVLVLSALLRQLHERQSFDPMAGVYLFCGPGPSHPKSQQELLSVPEGQRAAVLEKSLPPKDYFISNPAMKAAQVSIEFQLHGPWAAFLSPRFGLDQALTCAGNDLRDGVVPGAVVGGIFALDEPAELAHYRPYSPRLVEAVWVQYAESADQIADSRGPLGVYGPLTALLGSRAV